VDLFEGFENALPPVSMELLEEQLNRSAGLSALDRALLDDFHNLLFSDLLVKMDIATMQHSLEGRSPFLSKAMLELAPRLPDTMKIRGRTTKWALRELAKKLLPPVVVHQPKRGFEVPLKRWVNVELDEMIRDALGPGSFARSFVEPEFFEKLQNGKLRVSAEKRAKMLWSLFALEIWHRNEP